MNELNVIKVKGGAYIDSREVAMAIGKPHRHLLRDIRGYAQTIEKIGAPTFGPSDFFIPDSYQSLQNKEMPCYLISRAGCDMIANKLSGDRGIMFTAAYVKKFEEMKNVAEAAMPPETDRPALGAVNAAVRNILKGMAAWNATPREVERLLKRVYRPLGIPVRDIGDGGTGYLTATEIARYIGIFSETGRPHAHAVSAIIGKLDSTPVHAVIIPFGTVGVSVRYGPAAIDGVWRWICDNGHPDTVPHGGFMYHINYTPHSRARFADGGGIPDFPGREREKR